MPNLWNIADGVLLFGRYRIERTLEETSDHAFFLLEAEKPAARALVEVVRAEARGAEEQFQSWELGSRLSHPNLIRILETGRDRLDGESVLYALMEFPEEHLSDVLAERALTPEETREVALSLAETLAYLHKNGVVHANLRASQVAAADERVKIPVDRVLRTGSPPPNQHACPPPEWAHHGVLPAGDIWALGVLLHEVLTRQLPAFDGAGRPRLQGIDPQLAELIGACLRQDPDKRWTAPQVKRYLEGGGVPREERPPVASPAPPPRTVPVQPARPAAAPAQPAGRRHWVLIAVAVLIVLTVVWVLRQPKEVNNQAPPPAPVVTPPRAAAPANPKVTEAPPQRPPATGTWRVIVYTYNGRKPAEHKAATINKRHPSLHAEVFAPGGHAPFLVAVGGRMSRAEADRLQRKVRSLGLPRDSFARNFKE